MDAAAAAGTASSWPLLLSLLLVLSSAMTVSCGRPVRLTEGDTLYLRWQSGLGPLYRCSAIRPDGNETILADGPPPPPPQETDGKGDAGVAVDPAYVGDGYRSGQCGLRTEKVTPGVGDWTLRARTADGRQAAYTSRVTCNAKPWPRTSTVRVPLGTAVNVTCGPPTAFYCRMTGPSGEVSSHPGQCWVHVKSVGSHHLNAWTCWSVTPDSAAEVQYTVNLHSYRDGVVTEVGYDETASEVRVYCNVRDSAAGAAATVTRGADNGTAATGYCKLTLPRDIQTLSLAYGRGTARYAYHGTTDSECGVSFPKPLERSEIGRWKCANAMSDQRVYGGFVVVTPSNSMKGIPPLTVTAGQSLMVPKGNAFRVDCSVPSAIDYCWLRHPNGTAISVTVPDDGRPTHGGSGGGGGGRNKGSRYRYTGEGLSFGQCHVAVGEASTSDTGVWTCALGLTDDRREMYGTVNVTVSESVIAARQDELYATEGSRVTLGCYTVEKQPIVYCRFLTPRLFGFAVDERPSTPSPARYAYSGQGLTAGHCGLTVDRVDDADYGNWTCAVKILDSAGSEEVSTTVVLRKPEGFTMVQIIGIVLCGTLISVMSLFFANHLITNPSSKTRKKIEKLELLESAEMGCVGSRRAGARRALGSTRVVRTPPGRSKHVASTPRRI
ncbi:Immunoglobulin subtype,Immunoglobulin-like domain,Immunoglobulin-like fold [Cinara cedri]|uniref:Immunoglobulin subtype,Immunoglobulin-like domain,Immunoglobulin-like fold n=1 Tax=Cinara cedri TaxID=506608 RepID=A0A5E4N528_9HEMI|nr:Immunoglobulin subtype,Immunoglobulin-like domain,Immunoglobulin-like fold [Cinara cedri]